MRIKLTRHDEPDYPYAASQTAVTVSRRRRGESGLTLFEVLIALVIVVVVFDSIVEGYISTGTMAEWTGYSLAAQQIGVQSLEQTRSAVWDIALGKNEITNLNLIAYNWNSSNQTLTGYTTNTLDVPYSGTNYVIATNFITIKMIYINNSTNVPVQLQVVRVDTVWPFRDWANFSSQYLYTNSICTYMAPDNRDPGTLGCVDQ